MMIDLNATPLYTLPDYYRHRGKPSSWAEMTRPGQKIHSFFEGAFFDANQNLWLSDVPYGRIFRISPEGHWEVMHQVDGEPHSMRITKDGKHIAVDYRHGLIEFTGYDSFKVLSNGIGGQSFLGLSDMYLADDETLWFTDSGRSSYSNPIGRVYCRSSNGTVKLLLDCVPYSNGICLSHDGNTVYVSATRANQVWQFSSMLPKAGQPMVGTFLQLSGGLGPDGLATNSLGWLAVAQAQAGRSYLFDKVGDRIAEIRLPTGLWTTSVAFHPNDDRLLYIIDAQHASVFSCTIPVRVGK